MHSTNEGFRSRASSKNDEHENPTGIPLKTDCHTKPLSPPCANDMCDMTQGDDDDDVFEGSGIREFESLLFEST